MKNYLLYLRFLGTSYHGWQFQKNAVSIEQKVKEAVFSVTGENSTIYGCSRTDAGVHANMYCCNFYSSKDIEPDKMIKAINAYLPFDIAVYDCRIVSDDFHARFNAKSKEYIYKIYNNKIRNPFYEGIVFRYCISQLDVDVLNKCCKDFIGTHDFRSFCSVKCSVDSTVRTVTECEIKLDGEFIIFRVCADGFLYNMVRIMVGTLLRISEGRIDKAAIPSIINACDRKKAGITAPAEGLYLNKVIY